MYLIWSVIVAFILDLVLGDPAFIPHPVVLMGRIIKAWENTMRRRTGEIPEKEFRSGLMLAVCLPAGSFAISFAAILIALRIAPVAGFLLNTFWCFQCLAVKDMKKESINIIKKLESGSLEDSRCALSRIVGRDTGSLSREGIIKGAVESIAESFCDGITAPLFFMIIGGAPLALCYKAVNTMDSMVGYKNDVYINFGKAAAKLDDVFNFIPSRIAAVMIVFGAFLTGNDFEGAFRIWKRDRMKHESPNSAQTESAMAGALGIRLGGPASYFGEVKDKPYLGDSVKTPEVSDIKRALSVMYAASLGTVILMCSVRALAKVIVFH